MRNPKVYVYKKKESKNFYMKWIDPQSGKWKYKSTGTAVRREADRTAANHERDLAEDKYQSPSRITWEMFRIRFEDEYLSGLARKTQLKCSTTLNAIEKHLNPTYLREITSEAVSRFATLVRKPGTSESTIATHLAYLRVAMTWAKSVNLISHQPEYPKLRRAKRVTKATPMKGRPITVEEFERILAKIPSVIPSRNVPDWKRFLLGLWHSGLRLDEAIWLSWKPGPHISVDMTGKYPLFRIPAEGEKGFKDRLTPMAPDFARVLQVIPARKQKGFVFSIPLYRGERERPDVGTVSKTICKIGRAAGVKVNNNKHASAHDFRRSFGERWSHVLMPADLQQLMRHESIETTLRFYVGRNAENVAQKLWESQLGADPGAIHLNQKATEPIIEPEKP